MLTGDAGGSGTGGRARGKRRAKVTDNERMLEAQGGYKAGDTVLRSPEISIARAFREVESTQVEHEARDENGRETVGDERDQKWV